MSISTGLVNLSTDHRYHTLIINKLVLINNECMPDVNVLFDINKYKNNISSYIKDKN